MKRKYQCWDSTVQMGQGGGGEEEEPPTLDTHENFNLKTFGFLSCKATEKVKQRANLQNKKTYLKTMHLIRGNIQNK